MKHYPKSAVFFFLPFRNVLLWYYEWSHKTNNKVKTFNYVFFLFKIKFSNPIHENSVHHSGLSIYILFQLRMEILTFLKHLRYKELFIISGDFLPIALTYNIPIFLCFNFLVPYVLVTLNIMPNKEFLFCQQCKCLCKCHILLTIATVVATLLQCCHWQNLFHHIDFVKQHYFSSKIFLTNCYLKWSFWFKKKCRFFFLQNCITDWQFLCMCTL